MSEESKKNKIKYNRLGILILVIFLGFFAGISGEFFTRYYLSNLTFFRDLYFTDRDMQDQREIIIREPRKVVVEQDFQLNQIRKEIENTIVGIYNKKVSSSELLIDKVFLPADYIGQAVILTSDGWLISSANINTANQDNFVININKKLYEIEKIIIDEMTEIVFIKVDVQNLPVIKLGDNKNIYNSQQIIVYDSYSQYLDVSIIKDKSYNNIKTKYDFISSSEELDKYILLNKDLTANFKNSPIVNFSGEIIGILLSGSNNLNKAIPIYYITPIISQILKQEEVKRPYLGINYLNLAKTNGLTEENRQGEKEGALIVANSEGIAINEDSPLFGVLFEGDIIISIEDQNIDQNIDLLDIILEYKSGQEIKIKYIKEGNEKEISIALK